MKTNQEIFDFVVAHLREQGAKARDGTVCQYKAADGKKCAVGCLIKDEFYDASFEGSGVNIDDEKGNKVRDALHMSGIVLDEKNTALLSDLQWTHDSQRVEGWEFSFGEIAGKNQLKYAEI